MRYNANSYIETSKCVYKIIVYGIFFTVENSLADYINVKTSFGIVKGFESNNGEFSIVTYKNIPFAKQPVGELRFELPEETNVSQDSNFKEAIYCPQSMSVYTRLTSNVFGQEDCLYLDIYTRKSEKLQDLPVLVYFHAGRFSYGSKEEYSGDLLLNYNKIIIVIPNYRLGILGFIHNQDNFLPGNLGLWDQRMAMKWVYENIKSFGGDPQKITIAGHDAGGASVGFHIISKLSHGFFTAAISVSGTALDPWIMVYSSENAERIGRKLDCSSYFKDELKACLKNQTIRDILDVQVEMGDEKFRPVVDEKAAVPFLPFSPLILYEEGHQKDVSYLVGVSKDEASFEVNNEFATAIQTQHLDKIIQHILDPYLNKTPNLSLIVKAVKYHYLHGVPVPSFQSIKGEMISMLTDYLYNTPLYTTLKLHGRKTSNTFMYVFDDKEVDAYNDITDMGHVSDAVYIFNTTLLQNIIPNNITEVICTVWGNFIETKSISVYNWKKFSEKKMNYVEISETVKAKVDYKKKNIELWTILVPDLQKTENFSVVKPGLLIFQETNAAAWGVAGLVILLGVFCIALISVVVVTRKKLTQSSVVPINEYKEQIKYSSIE